MNHPIEKTIKRNLKLVLKKVDKFKHYNSKEHTFDGGWTRGYWEGQFSVLEDLYDILSELAVEELRIRNEKVKMNQMLIGLGKKDRT